MSIFLVAPVAAVDLDEIWDYHALAIQSVILPFTETTKDEPLAARLAFSMIDGKHLVNFCA